MVNLGEVSTEFEGYEILPNIVLTLPTYRSALVSQNLATLTLTDISLILILPLYITITV
jgi:hypothetical protein